MDDITFRNAMGKFATGVTVITTHLDKKIYGMTANAFMSVSLRPKLISVSVDERAHMHDTIKQTGKFAVNILSKDQQSISMHFAKQKKKDEEIDFDWVDQVPVIQHSLANIICTIHSSHKVGDHTIFIGEVLDIKLKDGMPLTFFEGKYGDISSS